MASLVKSASTIGGFTLLSRVFGFIRDMLISRYIGANMYTDAFFVAFKLPNFMRRIFAEGAFNSAFVPLFAGTLAGEGKEKALEFARDVYSVLAFVLLCLCALLMICMPWFMWVLAPGFSDDPVKFDLTVALTRITFPYLLFISLVSLLGGLLNSFERFAAVAATPILMNLCMIAGLLLLMPYTPTPAHALSISVTLSGVAQFAWLVYFARKMGIMPRLTRPRMTPNVKRLLTLMLPATFGAGLAQVSLMIDTILASHVPNGVSFLYYADRLNEFPLGVIGIAVGTALLPMLSKQLREGKRDIAIHSQNRAIEFTLLLALPSAIALAVIAESLVIVLFEGGEFTRSDSTATFHALMAYSFGLPAFVLTKVFAPGFFANQDTKTPFYIAACCLCLNIIINLILMQYLAHVGLALGTTITGWINATLMAVLLYRKNLFAADRQLLSRAPRILAAALMMGGVLWWGQQWLYGYFREDLLTKSLALGALITMGGTTYVVSALLFRAVDFAKLKSYMKRTP